MIYFSDFGAGASSTFGALVNKTTGQAIGTSWTTLTWDAEAYDTTGWHDNATNNSRITVPSGVTLARPQAAFVQGNINTPHIHTQKNGADYQGQGQACTDGVSGWNIYMNVFSAPVAVTAGDYFESQFIVLSGSGSPSSDDATWFSVESLSSSLKYALVYKSANQAITSGVTTTLTWNTETADTDGFHDNATNNSRLTVPSGVTLVRLSANLADSNVSGRILAGITKNGSSARGLPFRAGETGASENVNLVSAPIVVTTGDYFEVTVHENLTNCNILAGTYTWFCIEEVPSTYKRALVYKSANQSLSAGTGGTVLTFDSEVYDTDSIHDNVTNNSRLTVPSGCTKARVSYSLIATDIAGTMASWVHKNGATFRGTPGMTSDNAGTEQQTGISPWVDVTPGDYFELICAVQNARAITNGNETWFCLECQ